MLQRSTSAVRNLHHNAAWEAGTGRAPWPGPCGTRLARFLH